MLLTELESPTIGYFLSTVMKFYVLKKLNNGQLHQKSPCINDVHI